MLEAVRINGKSFQDVVFEPVSGPSAKLGGALALHPVPHGDDGFQAVKQGTVVLAIGGSYRGILGNCRWVKFFASKDILEVQRNIVGCAFIKLSHELLRQPDVVLLKTHLHAGFSILGLENGDAVYAGG